MSRPEKTKAPSATREWLKTTLLQHLKLRDGFSQNVGPKTGVSAEIYDTSKPYYNEHTHYHRASVRLEVPFIYPQAIINMDRNEEEKARTLYQISAVLQKAVTAELGAIASEELEAYLDDMESKAVPREAGFHTDRLVERMNARTAQVLTTDIIDRIAIRVNLAQLYYSQVSRQQYTEEGRAHQENFYDAMLRIGSELTGQHYDLQEAREDGRLGHRADAMNTDLYHYIIMLHTIREMAAQQDAIRLGDLSIIEDSPEGIWPRTGLQDWQPSALVLHELLADAVEHNVELLNGIKPYGYETWDWPERIHPDILKPLKESLVRRPA